MKRLFSVILAVSLSSSVACAQTGNNAAQVQQELSIFENPMTLKLKKGVQAKQLKALKHPALRDAAQKILAKNYDSNYRLATYPALLSPKKLGQQLSIGDGYSKYENATGMYLAVGEHTLLVDGIEKGKTVKLVVPNWLRKAPNPAEPTKDPKGWGLEKKEFTLQNGVNIITLSDFGSLAYIDYFSNTPELEKPITVHFLTGEVNGIFNSSKHQEADWAQLLEKAVYPVLDAFGKHIQIAYPVADLKKYAGDKGLQLLNNYDSLVYRQQRLLGLEKYNKVPANRILSRVNYNYYMFRDGDGVAYMGDKVGYAMAMVVDPNRVIKGDPCWGFSHEVGHVHQVRPYLNWGGLGEVSNNIFSLYVTRSFGNITRVTEQKNYDSARSAIIDKGISYLSDPDVFNRLIPFWQLQLYAEQPGANKDFYPDLFERFRQKEQQRLKDQPQPGRGDWANDRMRGERNPAVHQLNFIKDAVQVAKVDLTGFFEAYGFFYVGTIKVEDYGDFTYEMTQEMVDACKAEIKALNLPKPSVDLTTLRD